MLPEELVTVVNADWFGSDVIELTYKTATGKLGSELVYREQEAQLEVAERGRPWSFDGDGKLFRLVSEAYRIHLAYLFEPLLAVHTSEVEPLPHRSRPSTRRCCPASRCVTCWRTTRDRERPS